MQSPYKPLGTMDEPEPDAAASQLRKKLIAIEKDDSLSLVQKSQQRQALMTSRHTASVAAPAGGDAKGAQPLSVPNGVLAASDAKRGSHSLQGRPCQHAGRDAPVRHLHVALRPARHGAWAPGPPTLVLLSDLQAPCQHNFCLVCFTKWVQQSKTSCPTCRAPIPPSVRSNPRINAALVCAIRMARPACSLCAGLTPLRLAQAKRGERAPSAAAAAAKIANDARPDEAFVTDRAVRGGLANAASGRIFVTVPSDHFGPIPAAADPQRNRGVLVGDSWGDRLECRQWGAHFPHVAGIAGQSAQGAQSVALSGGCATIHRLSRTGVLMADPNAQVRGRHGRGGVVHLHRERWAGPERQQAHQQGTVLRPEV